MVTTTHISSRILPSVGPDLSAIANPRCHRSDGAYRGQGTIAETLAGWDAAVWSADGRGLGAGIDFATARGFLGNVYSNDHTESLPFFSVLFRALRLPDPHIILKCTLSGLSDSCQTARTSSSLGLSFWKFHCSSSTTCSCLRFPACSSHLVGYSSYLS